MKEKARGRYDRGWVVQTVKDERISERVNGGGDKKRM